MRRTPDRNLLYRQKPRFCSINHSRKVRQKRLRVRHNPQASTSLVEKDTNRSASGKTKLAHSTFATLPTFPKLNSRIFCKDFAPDQYFLVFQRNPTSHS
jgi:hypothetical protein